MLYQRKLLNEPDIQKELSGGIEYPHDITLQFSNADGYFSDLWDGGEEFRGKTVKLRRYETEDSEALKYELTSIITSFNILPDIAEFTVSVQDPDPLQALLPKKLYEIGDWSQSAPNIINPTPDLGKPYPLVFGNAKKAPLRYVHADYTSDYYDYIVCRTGSFATESNNSNKSTTVNIYRNKILVGSSEYTVYDGSQASPYPGYAFIRFTKEQRDFSGNLYELHADFRGIKFTGDSAATRNFAKIIQYLLSDSTIGLGLSVDSASFTTAISAISDLYCDGYIAEQSKAQDILNELLDMCRGSLSTNENGERVITIDTYQSTSQATFGLNDGYWNNIISIKTNKDKSTRDAMKSISLNYRYNGWENVHSQKNSRSVFSFGEEVVIDARFVRDHTTADKITCFKQRLQQYGDHQLEIEVGMEGRFLERFDPVTIKIPALNINGTFQVRNLSRGINTFNLELMEYSSSIYTYVVGTLPGDENADDETDYSNTAPDAPTSFSRTSWEMAIGIDGTTFQAANLQATAPSENFSHMLFGYKLSSGSIYTYFEGQKPASGYVWTGKTTILTPGQSYDFVAVSVNVFNLRSSPATITSQVPPGDSTAPAQVTGMAGTGKYKTWNFTWTKNTEADLKGYHVQIATDSGFSNIIFDKYIDANNVGYTSDSIGYGTLYCRVKAVDYTGNESAAWSSTALATTSQAQTADVGGDQITYAKRQQVETQSVSYSLDAGFAAQYIFSHSLGRIPVFVPYLTGAVESWNTNVVPTLAGSSNISIYLKNNAGAPVSGTLNIAYW